MKRLTGFTLIELMLTLLVIGVIAAIAVPRMNHLAKNNRLVSKSNELVSLINLARTEAISQSSVISICGSDSLNDPRVCDTSNWHLGAIMFKGAATAGYTPAATDIIKVFEPLESGITLSRQTNSSAVPAGFNASYLRFDGSGMLFSADASSFKLCDDRGANRAKGININSAGQLRIATDSNDDGTVELIYDAALTEITCP